MAWTSCTPLSHQAWAATTENVLQVQIWGIFLRYCSVSEPLDLSGHGQFPVSMATERVSAESHDQNFIEKEHLFPHARERQRGWSDATDKRSCVWVWRCSTYRFYQPSVKSVMRAGKREMSENGSHIIKVEASVCGDHRSHPRRQCVI